MTTNTQLDAFFEPLDRDPKHYRGTIYEEFLLKFTHQKPMAIGDFFILNIGNLRSGGTHWTAFMRNGEKEYSYFDSYGVLPSEFVHKFEKKFNVNVKYSTKQFQRLDTDVCGQWCCAWLLWMMKDSYESFIDTFELGDI